MPDHAKMPEELEPARFPGHEVPVTLEFVSLVREDSNFPEVRLRAINHSDKAIRKLQMTFTYLDADGKALKDWPSGHGAPANLDGDGPAVVVGPTDRAEFNATAFFMPEATQRVSVTVKSVEFADGTQWNRK